MDFKDLSKEKVALLRHILSNHVISYFKYTDKYRESSNKEMEELGIPMHDSISTAIKSFFDAEEIVKSNYNSLMLARLGEKLYMIDPSVIGSIYREQYINRTLLNDIKHNLGDPASKMFYVLMISLVDITDILTETDINIIMGKSLIENDFSKKFFAENVTSLQKLEYFKELAKETNE